jgi:SAM-dependent MidA family methyltransferase
LLLALPFAPALSSALAPSPELPVPDALARAHSARVREHIAAEIAAAGGWIPFARYMELALYAPGLGYYAAGATKFGLAGDFVTAPEMTPLYAQALAAQAAAVLAASPQRAILELGAGSGRLAADLLAALAARGASPAQYAILEPSPDLRARQRAAIGRDAAAGPAVVRWLDVLPPAIEGLVVANEVLDAVPAHLVARRGGEMLERGVALAGGAGDAVEFAWAERAADARIAALARARFPDGGDYVSEVNPAAEALVETLGRRLAHGAILLIDYGFPAAEYYHPQRSAGTLMCHYRHRTHDDPFAWPGLTDITGHVDFSAMAAAGARAGLRVAGFASQAQFLAGCGILDALAQTGPPDSLAYIEAAAQVQRLLSPAEMGELFKVLALARTDGIAWPGFALGERSHRL